MPMRDFLATVAAEIRALGWRCFEFGPEAWLALTALCVFSAGVIIGMFLAALLGANGRDDDER